MCSAQWMDLIDESGAFSDLFGRTLKVSDFRLIYVHIDERNTGVTLGFELARLPDRPPAQWVRKGFNASQFLFRFAQVTRLGIENWCGFSGAREPHVTLSRDHTGLLHVMLAAGDETMSFHAATARLAEHRAFLASSSW
ncbi:Imm50 family immunity protein [Streptomyces sp. NPDC001922]|uniref:Imm50 family immunity protein n=1 Tax=Streptomyces sp. NPDC001922 TaxID=3364624 RepID=UPI0036BB334C